MWYRIPAFPSCAERSQYSAPAAFSGVLSVTGKRTSSVGRVTPAPVPAGWVCCVRSQLAPSAVAGETKWPPVPAAPAPAPAPVSGFRLKPATMSPLRFLSTAICIDVTHCAFSLGAAAVPASSSGADASASSCCSASSAASSFEYTRLSSVGDSSASMSLLSARISSRIEWTSWRCGSAAHSGRRSARARPILRKGLQFAPSKPELPIVDRGSRQIETRIETLRHI